MNDPRTSKRKTNTRLVWVLVGGLALLGVSQLYLLDVGQSGTSHGWLPGGAGLREERFQPLSPADHDILRTQRGIVAEMARRHVGTPLAAGDLHDLSILQRVVDLKIVKPDQTFELQALGVALGDVMAEQLGLDWVVVEDEWGRSRALRLGQTETVIFPVTMVAKRIERDVDFTLDELYRKTRRTVEQGRK